MEIKYIIKSLIVACIIILTGCEREEPQLLSEITIQFEMPDDLNGTPIPDNKKTYANREVRIKSSATEYIATTDASGKAVFKNVLPDLYSISTSWQLSESDYNDLTNQNIQLELGSTPLLAGNNPRVQLFENKLINEQITFKLIKSLMISKVYYTMSKSNENRNYQTDGYIELYNNAETPVSLENLYIGITETLSPPAFLAKDNPEFVYLRQVAKVPDGITLEGYQSFLIALRNAIDHTQNAPKSVNLVNADAEVKQYSSNGNPAITASPIVFNASGNLQYLSPLNKGGSGFVIFKTTDDITKWEALPPPDKPNYNQKFLKVDNRIIMDGVETLEYKSTGIDVNLKRINNSIDATYIFNTGGSYSSEACERRVERVEEFEGKVVYRLLDTNNSLNDFRMTTTNIQPRIYDKPELMP